MRILMLCYEFPPLGGGGGRVVAGLSRELVRKGLSVDVVTMGFGALPATETLDGVRLHRLPCVRWREHYCTVPEAGSFLLSSWHRLPRLLESNGYDITHAHFVLPDGWNAWRLRRSTGLPYVITAHGSDVPGYNPDRLRLAHRVLRPVWRRVAQSAGTIVSPSRYLESLIQASSNGIASEVIPHGFELPAFQPPDQRQGILVVSRLLPRKGVRYLFEALSEETLDHEIHVVGDGPELPALRQEAVERGLPVKFHGWLENPSPQLTALFESCALFVLPSESENFPVSLLEAMSARLAVVTTAGSGCSEVVGETGILVEPGNPGQLHDAVLALLGDPDRCRLLGHEARQRVREEFSWDVVADRYVEVYERHRAEIRR